jgi:hypothetical protein
MLANWLNCTALAHFNHTELICIEQDTANYQGASGHREGFPEHLMTSERKSNNPD